MYRYLDRCIFCKDMNVLYDTIRFIDLTEFYNSYIICKETLRSVS